MDTSRWSSGGRRSCPAAAAGARRAAAARAEPRRRWTERGAGSAVVPAPAPRRAGAARAARGRGPRRRASSRRRPRRAWRRWTRAVVLAPARAEPRARRAEPARCARCRPRARAEAGPGSPGDLGRPLAAPVVEPSPAAPPPLPALDPAEIAGTLAPAGALDIEHETLMGIDLYTACGPRLARAVVSNAAFRALTFLVEAPAAEPVTQATLPGCGWSPRRHPARAAAGGRSGPGGGAPAAGRARAGRDPGAPRRGRVPGGASRRIGTAGPRRHTGRRLPGGARAGAGRRPGPAAGLRRERSGPSACRTRPAT